jgi:hypothetical protein
LETLIVIEPQTMQSAIGLHGAGGYRTQRGLVEGSLMFIGIFFKAKGKSDLEIAASCYEFADTFTNKFKSVTCYNLRPQGFNEIDPPHACEKITGEAIAFAYDFIVSHCNECL